MNDINILCDELCSNAGLNKAALLSGKQREITQHELTALATAYATRIGDYNHAFVKQIRKPLHPFNLPKVWAATFGAQWGLALKKRIRNGQTVFFINYGAK